MRYDTIMHEINKERKKKVEVENIVQVKVKKSEAK